MDRDAVPAQEGLSEEILRRYTIIPPRAQGVGFLRRFTLLIISRPNEPLTREMILAELERTAGRPPAKATLDHLLQVAVRAGYVVKVADKITGEQVWVARETTDDVEQMFTRLDGLARDRGHARQPRNETGAD
jgi:hypothetical protein